ncbi:MAG TPA: saccharopine dehydrogenase NADP-binding domain-containing protein [Candidatus Saccharimonadales bacterium]|nr:saccharopine dehydrogenase NADP-binding domain-containing protein [Candidatus Saccharimonadales bacterium]
MINPEVSRTNNPEYPFLHNKIPVAEGLEGFSYFAEHYPGFTFCPYVAEKDTEGWAKSTSRVYMNQVLPNFLYVPVNIHKGSIDELRTFFGSVQDRKDIPAVNITQPHKSSPVLRELYLGDVHSEANVDTLIRNDEGYLEPYDLNSAAFVEWYKDEVDTFQGRPVVLVGVGGVGEPIAKKIAAEKPSSLTLVDVTDKTSFAARLSRATQVEVTFNTSLQAALASGLPEGGVVINAAGKEGATDESELWQLIQKDARGSTFVDIRPHLDIEIVEEAKRHGWSAYTGYGMNARNDYVLLQGIARQIPGAIPPSFDKFQELVSQAS